MISIFLFKLAILQKRVIASSSIIIMPIIVIITVIIQIMMMMLIIINCSNLTPHSWSPYYLVTIPLSSPYHHLIISLSSTLNHLLIIKIMTKHHLLIISLSPTSNHQNHDKIAATSRLTAGLLPTAVQVHSLDPCPCLCQGGYL